MIQPDKELQAQADAGVPPSRLVVAGTSRKKGRPLLPREAIQFARRGVPSFLLSFDLSGSLDAPGLAQWLVDLGVNDDLDDPEIQLHMYGSDSRIVVLSVGRHLKA